MTKEAILPLEDELGDVLEKAMRQAGIGPDALAQQANVPLGRILDAIDYRPDFSEPELIRLSTVLGLNEVGMCALGLGRYPLPELGVLPFCVWPLAMPHGIGVANAYLVGECGSSEAILFDAGMNFGALDANWPVQIRRIAAVFVTHLEAEHAGGLSAVVARYDVGQVFVPAGSNAASGNPVGEGCVLNFGPLEVSVFATPGHAAAHNCYLVRAPQAKKGIGLLLSGDLVFAGSAGGAEFSPLQLQSNLRRMLSVAPENTIIAPGHGPMTTVENERRYNPFSR